MPQKHLDQIKILILVVCIFITAGSSGYIYLEGLSPTDAVLRTLLTFSTLGYSEATTQSDVGKWFTIALILVGVGVIVYATSGFVRAVIEGEISGSWKRHMVHKRLDHLKDHIIVCGFGRVGRQVAEELAAEDEKVVVIDKNDKSSECEKLGYVFVQGDVSASDEVLTRAGITRARTIIIAIGTDSESLAASVNARALNPDIFIVARATNAQAESRLLRIGANRVAMPAFIGGYHMATMALRPTVVDFLDLVIDSKHGELQIEELEVEHHSKLVGERVMEKFANKRSGVACLAMKRKGSAGFARPTATMQVEAGDKLILMGTLQQLDTLLGRK